MIEARQHDLATRYVAQQLSGDSLRAFEAELSQSAELRQFVHELQAAAAVTPTTQPSAGTPASFRRFLPWMLAAAFALGCLWLGQLHQTNQAEIAIARDQQALTNLELLGNRQQLEAERILATRELAEAKRHVSQLDEQVSQATRQLAESRREYVGLSLRYVTDHAELKRLREQFMALSAQAEQLQQQLQPGLAALKLFALTPNGDFAPSARVLVAWNPVAQAGLLQATNLPPPDADHEYHLWLFDASQAEPIDAGAIALDFTAAEAPQPFKPAQPVADARRFGLSLTAKSAAPATAGPFLLQAN